MIDGLRPYPEMKPSGVEWLGKVPVGWEVHRAKYAFHEVDDRSEQGDEELLSVSHKTGVTPRSQKNVTMFMAESYADHKVCRAGDIVVNTMWAWMAALGVARQGGIVSPAYGVYRPRNQAYFEPQFLDYLLRTEVYRAEYVRSSRGITTSRLRLYPPDFLNIPFIQPPLDEQRLIAQFLNWHGAQTAKLIRAKKRLIALLNEEKQAIVRRVVTRGVNPDVKLGASGIRELGDVPAHWEVKRLKAICRINPSNGPERRQGPDEMVTFLPMDRVGTDGVIDPSLRLRLSEVQIGYSSFQRGDVILAKITPCFENGKGAVLEFLPTRVGFGSTEFIVLRASNLVDPFLLYLFISEPHFRQLGVESMTGSAGQQRISREFVANHFVALPPRAEQAGIIEAVKVAKREIGAAIELAGREIALIQEFRTRLIADVVTGKLDVRAVAAALPEVTDAERIEEPDADDDLDETDLADDDEVAA